MPLVLEFIPINHPEEQSAAAIDVFSRLIAPHLAKTLGTTVIVENQPGAGGLVALNRLYVAPPDGLQISLSQGTMAAFAQLMGDQAARFDLTKFTYLATVGAPPGLWLVGRTRPSRKSSRRSMPRKSGAGPPRAARPGSASAPPSPARRSSSIAMWCRDTRRAQTPGFPSRAARWTRSMCRNRHANTFREGQAEAGRWRRSRATKSRFFPDRPTDFRGGEDRSRPCLGFGFLRQY